MFKRLRQSGLNLLVLGVSAGIFLVAFLVLQGMVRARTPETAAILVAAGDVQIGERITSADLRELSVYVDETTPHYFSAAEAGQLLGAFAALPLRSGQPVARDALIAPGAAAERFSALLAIFPGHSLFPLPLDAANVVAPPAELFLPGDLVGLTVVIRGRPQPPATPTPSGFTISLPGVPPENLPPVLPQPTPAPEDDLAARGYPPLAKDLFPAGLRVAGIQGLPEPAGAGDDSAGGAPAFNTFGSAQMLILLVPDEGRERLSLAFQQGDFLFVSLLGHAGNPESTAGFTYWDFEAWFQADRATPAP